MKRFALTKQLFLPKQALLLLCLLLLAACAPTSTPAPTPAAPTRALPQPSATRAALPPATSGPSGTPAPITITGVTKETQSNGEVRTTARAAAEGDLGLGQIEVASPERMGLGETRTVRLRISPAQQLVASTPVAVPASTPGLPGFVYKFSGNVQLYPVMLAELRAVTFAVAPTGPQRRDLLSSSTVEWSWLVNSKSAGQQDLSISLQVPAIVNGVPSELGTNPLEDIPVTIRVDAAPVNNSPASLWETAMKSIADNTGPIVIALIGLVGTMIGILIKSYYDSKERGRRKEPK